MIINSDSVFNGGYFKVCLSRRTCVFRSHLGERLGHSVY